VATAAGVLSGRAMRIFQVAAGGLVAAVPDPSIPHSAGRPRSVTLLRAATRLVGPRAQRSPCSPLRTPGSSYLAVLPPRTAIPTNWAWPGAMGCRCSRSRCMWGGSEPKHLGGPILAPIERAFDARPWAGWQITLLATQLTQLRPAR
jgi:hypothetical protein